MIRARWRFTDPLFASKLGGHLTDHPWAGTPTAHNAYILRGILSGHKAVYVRLVIWLLACTVLGQPESLARALVCGLWSVHCVALFKE